MLNLQPLSKVIASQAEVYGDRRALRYRDYEKGMWKDISWRTFAQRVRATSNALLELGVGVQENVAVFSQNMVESLFVDFGCYGIRATSIPFYATSSESQVRYMINDANIRYVFVGEQYQYDVAFRVLKMCPTLTKLIIVDKSVQKNDQDRISIYFHEFLQLGEGDPHAEEIERRTSEAIPEDLANILYTSGTTGLSKGVQLSHSMYNHVLKNQDPVLDLTDKDVVLNFLPFTHVFERAWTYLCICKGCTLCVNLRPADVLQSLKEVHPTCMCSVPRFWEKVYAGVQEKIRKSNTVQRKVLHEALELGKAYNVDYKMRGLVPPVRLRMKYALYEKTVISLLKKELGLERAHFFPTAGSSIPREVEIFVHSAGINMIAGYGLTESTATVSCDWVGRPKTIGSVGRVLDGIEIKFGENNEILLRGETITKGYYRKQEVTDSTIDSEGWFHTGDAGYLQNGELFLTDRIKDLFKTSNGKYIAPQMIETKLVVDRYIDQIVIIADRRKFVSALIIPDYPLLKELAQQLGISDDNIPELCKNRQIVDFYMNRIDTLQQEFAHYEHVKRITLLPEPFSMDRGELTNTLKIKRPVINKNYAGQIEAMYDETNV
ncbi:MAG: long-chain fatty acid--CoA ligase [Bacteroidaceae bacterium]|nr:long-chain fatty acid--CoA ligase [Bacteroidaceae bacterium]